MCVERLAFYDEGDVAVFVILEEGTDVLGEIVDVLNLSVKKGCTLDVTDDITPLLDG